MRQIIWLSTVIALSLSCSAEEVTLNKRISVNYRNALLADVFKDIGEKTGVRIAAAENLLQNQDNVFYTAMDQEAGRVLARILRPHRLKVEVNAAGSVSLVKLPSIGEFHVKPEQVFEFEEKPKITQDGSGVRISFASKAWCDASVAIEDAEGRILRHLASGVLGDNAPEPFQWNSKKQTLVWDGKNNKGEYVDRKEGVRVRVSLGLKAAYEKPLFWSPYKRWGDYPPIICPAPEGVYVFDGHGTDHLRLFDHDGNYIRTIYPFPAAKLDQIGGLEKQSILQTGQSLPRKLGYQQATLLNSGNSCVVSDNTMFGDGFGATAMAVQGDRIALAFLKLNRLRTDGSTGGLALQGPKTGFMIPGGTFPYIGGEMELGPCSAAFSPDGKTLYLTGYVAKHGIYDCGGYCRHSVYKLSYDKDQEPALFAGTAEPNADGTDNAHFAVPISVACDAKGRVYVADFLNDRVQVFDADGKYLKSIASARPAKVQIDPRTQELYVYSWYVGIGLHNDLVRRRNLKVEELQKIQPALTRFGSFDDPKVMEQLPLPLPPFAVNQYMMGPLCQVEIDFWAKTPTLWMVGRNQVLSKDEVSAWGKAVIEKLGSDDAANAGISLLVQDGKKWVPRRRFSQDAFKSVVRLKPPSLGTQRLYVNEKNHKLYVLEHLGFNKSHHTLLEIDAQTETVNPVRMPFRAEDICFDLDGHIYMRTDREVVRYDSQTWREVPWDYGDERQSVSFDNDPAANALSALPIPGARPMWFHQYGMWVSPKGHLAVSCVNRDAPPDQNEPANWRRADSQARNAKTYQPVLYQGRARHQEIHIWDEHGKLIREDAVPGLGVFNGLGIDKDDNIFVMFDAGRYLDDKVCPNRQAGTVIKFKSRGAEWGDVRILSSSQNIDKRYVPYVPMPLQEPQIPKRPPDTSGGIRNMGEAWMTGAEWFYGGAGITGAGCNCWHSRFCIDTYARAIVPEPDLYSVAVLDSDGNLIVRIGRYGNEDDGIALAPNPTIKTPQSIGGDEVPLFYPAYVATDTDRRLFISDVGNARIVSVKLGYHAEEMLPLRDMPDLQKK